MSAPDGPTGAPRRVRRTRQGAAVLAALEGSASFKSAQEVHAALRAAGERVGLTTVYRHLQLLADEGVIDAVQAADGQVVYRHCRTGEHHHHLVCRACGASVEIAGPEVEAWAEATARALGYSAVSHTVEIFGLCPSCSGRARRSG